MEDIYNTLSGKIKNKLKDIKFFVLDFDGVFTDNSIYHASDGSEIVSRSRYDSIGFDLLRDVGLISAGNSTEKDFKILIISRETNSVVASVAKKLQLTCTQSQYDKPQALQEEIKRYNFTKNQVLFIGNDLNDLACFNLVGLSIAPADADARVIKEADYVTKLPGGRGAVREVCELILYAKDIHPYK